MNTKDAEIKTLLEKISVLEKDLINFEKLPNKIISLQEIIDRLNTENKKNCTEIESQKFTIEGLISEKTKLTELCQTTQKEKQELLNKIISISISISAMEKEKAILTSNIEDLKKAVEEREKDKSQLSMCIESVGTKMIGYSEKEGIYRDEINTLKTTLETNNKNHADSMYRLQTEYRNTKKSLLDQLNSVQRTNTENETIIKNLNEKIALDGAKQNALNIENTSRIEQCIKTINEKEAMIEQLKSQIQSLENDKVVLNEQLKTLCDTESTIYKKINDEKRHLSHTIVLKTEEINKLNERVNILSTSLAVNLEKFTNDLNAKNRELNNLSVKVDEYTNTIEKLKSEKDSIVSSNKETLEKIKTDYSETMTKLIQTNESQKSTITDLRNTMSTIKQELYNKYNNEISDLKKDVLTLSQILEKERFENSTKNKELAIENQTKIERFEKNIFRLETEAVAKNNQIKTLSEQVSKIRFDLSDREERLKQKEQDLREQSEKLHKNPPARIIDGTLKKSRDEALENLRNQKAEMNVLKETIADLKSKLELAEMNIAERERKTVYCIIF